MSGYARDYSRVVRYGAGSPWSLFKKQFEEAPHYRFGYPDERGREHPDHTFRKVAADAYQEETGDDAGADLIRDTTKHFVFDGDRVVPGAFKYRQAFYTDNDPELEELIHNEGLQEASQYIRDNYDYGSGPLASTPSGGRGEHRHTNGFSDPGEEYTIGHHPGLGYVYTEHRMEVPETATHVLEGGKLLHGGQK